MGIIHYIMKIIGLEACESQCIVRSARSGPMAQLVIVNRFLSLVHNSNMIHLILCELPSLR